MITPKRYLLSAVILLHVILLNPSAVGQGTTRFAHLSVQDGLSQSGVTCVFQDHQGFMWFGTQDGLNRFDGYNITVFKHVPEDTTSLIDNFVIMIGEDENDDLWINTLNAPEIFSVFDRRRESFKQHPRAAIDPTIIRRGATFSSYTDASGVRWSGSIGGGLIRTDPTTGKSVNYRNDSKNAKSLIDNKVYSVYGDRSGTIWVGTQGGLERYDATIDGFIHYRHDPRNSRSISHNWVWPILEDRNGTLWVGTFGGGLNRFDRTTGTFSAFRHDDSNPRSIADDRMYSLTQDASGMIWVGTADHGVDRFHPERNFFSHVVRDPTNPSSLSSDNVTALHVQADGRVWVGTTNGLNLYDPRSGIIQTFRNQPGNEASVASNAIVTIMEDRQGFVWIGFVNSGLDRYDPRSGVFRHYRNDPNNPGSLSDNRVYALLEDRQARLWVGTYGGGLNLLDRAASRFTRYQNRESDSTSLGANGVWSLCEDRDGTLWVGTYGGGVNQFDPRTGVFTRYVRKEGESGGLSDNTVVSMLVARDGTPWFGTMGGLNRFDRDSRTFQSYRQKDGLVNDVILGLLQDDTGALWMSTNKGLVRFDPVNSTFQSFDSHDGLQGDEFVQNAYARDKRSGMMYVGGANGFNGFHPDSVRQNPYVPPVVFSGFTRYNSDEKEGEPIVERGIAVKREIALSYRDNVATFQFAALNYSNPFRNQYAYQLEGFTEGWIQLGAERKATFTNLDAGTYILRVRGSNDDRLWNERGASMRLIVTPPWWKTRWAYTGYGVLIFGFLYGMRRFELERREQKARVRESELRTKAALAEKRVLEAENERKSKELEDARQLQLSMLPKEIPHVEGYEIAVSIRTATEVGGDYYDFSLDEDGALNIALGDATGHGMQAGTIVTLMKGLFLSEGTRSEIRAFFNHSSRAIKEIKLGRLFMAFTLVRLRGNSVSFACAGMPPVFIYRHASQEIEEHLLKGMPLGAMKKFEYAVQESALADEDVLLLVTDGLPEQKNASSDMFDYDRVRAIFAEQAHFPAATIVDALYAAGDAWMEGVPQDDDITVLVLKKKAAVNA